MRARDATELRERGHSARAPAAEESALRARGADDAAIAPPSGSFCLRLDRLPSSVAVARHELSRWLGRHGVGAEHVLDATLACSEACANAVEHPVDASRDAFVVEASCTPDEIVVAVRDFGRWRLGGLRRERGRGLRMIHALTDSTEILRGDRETTIVMRRARRPSQGG